MFEGSLQDLKLLYVKHTHTHTHTTVHKMGGRNYLRACACIIGIHHHIGVTAPEYLHTIREATATAPHGDHDLVPRAYSRARRVVWASLGIQADSSTRSRREDRAEKGGGEGASAGEGDGEGKAAGGSIDPIEPIDLVPVQNPIRNRILVKVLLEYQHREYPRPP